MPITLDLVGFWLTWHVAGGYEGTVQDAEIRLKEMVRAHDTLNEILVKHTRQPIDKVRRDMDRDFFMSAQEALEYGIIDKIAEKGERQTA